MATSLFRSLTDRLGTPSTPASPHSTKPRSDGFLTATGMDALFPRTDPAIDGDECQHDCETCTIAFPRKFTIDTDDRLYGEINGWERHLIVATGKTDWVRDVEDEKDSVMQAVGKHRSAIANGKLMLSASNIPLPDGDANDDSDAPASPYGPNRPTSVLLLPAFTFVDNVTPTLIPALIDAVINPSPTNTTPYTSTPLPTSLPGNLSLRACPHQYLILLCSQATRDARCGQSAPLLRRELERHLRPLGLYRDLHDSRPGGVGIYFISHVGGHKYSANVMVYRRGAKGSSAEETFNEAAQCIWIARVRPADCENLVRFTVLQGKVVKPESQLRGGFDRERGVVSW